MYCAFEHPLARAGAQVPANLQCRNCGRLHCDACVRKVKVGREFVDACAQPNCHGLLREVVITNPTGEPFMTLARRVFSFEGVTTTLAVALPGWASALPGLRSFMSLLYCAAAVSMYFLIIDHLARGKEGLPTPSEGLDSWGEILKTVFRAVLCLIVVVLPLVLYLYFSGAGRRAEEGDAPVSVLVSLVFLALAVSYLPAVILSIVITQRSLAALWPPLWFEVAMRAPAAYARLVGVFLLSSFAWWTSVILGAALFGGVPIFGGLIIVFGSTLILFVQAVLLGDFLRRHAIEFGYQ